MEKKTGLTGKELHNFILRAGLRAIATPAEFPDFHVQAKNMGTMVDVANIGELLETLDSEPA